MNARAPQVLAGALEGWPAYPHLSRRALAERYGTVVVPVHFAPRGWSPATQFDADEATRLRAPEAGAVGMTLGRMPLAALIEATFAPRAGTGPLVSASAIALHDIAPGLAAVAAVPAPAAALGATSASLWVGPAGKTVPLHRDGADGVLGQVESRKRLRFVAASHTDALRPLARNPALSPVRDVGTLEASWVSDVTLSPGDLVVVPAGWWHQVDYLDPCISVNFWPPSYLGRP